MLAMQSTLLASVASAQAPDAKASLASGDKAARAKDWAKAQADYEAANAAAPSADALDGLANAHYQQKHDAEAYAAYESWIKTYGTTSPAKKRAAEARLEELGSRTVTPRSSSRRRAAPRSTSTTSPWGRRRSPRRSVSRSARIASASPRTASFRSIRRRTSPRARPRRVQVKLEAQTTKGRLSVREKSGKAIRVFVDGVDMGDAPVGGRRRGRPARGQRPERSP